MVCHVAEAACIAMHKLQVYVSLHSTVSKGIKSVRGGRVDVDEQRLLQSWETTSEHIVTFLVSVSCDQ